MPNNRIPWDSCFSFLTLTFGVRTRRWRVDMIQNHDISQQAVPEKKDVSPGPKQHLDHIDFLKVIGLLCIFIAHAGAPHWLFMLRSFDVPLMVILSALLCQKSYERSLLKGMSGWSFLSSRFKRLVIPAWIFLFLFFLLQFLHHGKLYGLRYYIDSFCLTRYGIRYIWIVLIFLYSAVWIPVFHGLSRCSCLPWLVLFLYAFYEICYRCGLGVSNPVLDSTFYYFVPYGCLTYLGVRYCLYDDRQKVFISLISFFIFCGFFIYYWYMTGSPQLVQIAKYPPRIYYLSYGIFVSYALLFLSERIRLNIYSHPIVVFVSSHSMWIYLWHILMLALYDEFGLPHNWLVKFLVVSLGACMMVYLVNTILDRIEKKTRWPHMKYLRG